jgi:Domain of unknown function (DUF4224)
MRLSRQELTGITGRMRKSAHAAWFKQHFGIILPIDRNGPIIIYQAYQDLSKAKCDLLHPQTTTRPQVKLRDTT